MEPLVAGDTLDFLTTVSAYPPGDGWTLTYRLIPMPPTAGGPTVGSPVLVLTSTASPAGDQYRTQAGASVTAQWAPGAYNWTSSVDKAGISFEVDSGGLDDGDEGPTYIRPNPRTLPAGYDGRSSAARAVDDLTAALYTYQATQGMVKEYAIGSRRVVFRDAKDIQQQLGFAQAALAREQAIDSINRGKGNPRNKFVIFGPPASPWISQ